MPTGAFPSAAFDRGPCLCSHAARAGDSRASWSNRSTRDVTVELTRMSERPAREMKMLPEPIPPDESRALARRLVEPLWDHPAHEEQDSLRNADLTKLSSVDPARVLGMLESVKFRSEGWKNRFLTSSCSRYPAPISKRRQR